MPSTDSLMTRFLCCTLAIATCVGSLPAFGQDKPAHNTFLGISGGAGLVFSPAWPQRVDLPPTYLAANGNTGESGALSVLIRVRRGHWFGQSELRYQNVYSAGFTYFNGVRAGFLSFSTNTTVFHVQQLELAALGGYAFGPRQQLYWLLGPALAVRQGNDGIAAPSASSNLRDKVLYAMDTAPSASQLQLHGGLGWWGKRLSVEARYTYGLTPLVRRISFDNQTHNFQVGADTFMFTVGYHGQLGRHEEAQVREQE